MDPTIGIRCENPYDFIRTQEINTGFVDCVKLVYTYSISWISHTLLLFIQIKQSTRSNHRAERWLVAIGNIG